MPDLTPEQLRELSPLAAVIAHTVRETPVRLAGPDPAADLVAALTVRVAAYVGGILPAAKAQPTAGQETDLRARCEAAALAAHREWVRPGSDLGGQPLHTAITTAVLAVVDVERAEQTAIDTQVMEKADRECDEHIAAGRAFRQLAERTQAWGEQHRDRANRYRDRVDRGRAECAALDADVHGLSPAALAGRRDAVARIRAALAPQAGDDATGEPR